MTGSAPTPLGPVHPALRVLWTAAGALLVVGAAAVGLLTHGRGDDLPGLVRIPLGLLRYGTVAGLVYGGAWCLVRGVRRRQSRPAASSR
ncbi:hypothetical protein [Streptomyces sp. MUM 178J]|uniref:hypothetical protein n=1 Tax=Streptomyces sp. MUM 178J TaxID=2791991 RepID=UPI001F04A7FB|nr:hypothetical protein [Streptomyces sp. MUM 178J]WRQ79515.1 hypothetical protein I3F59_009135 [Streptomyces sp. MUM 178J]